MTADYERVEKAIRFIEENFRRQPPLADIAASVGLSEFHFQRLFRRWAGVSPKRFLQYLTAGYARELLRQSRSVLDVAFEAGLTGSGRLHDLTVNIHAATPGELKERGAGLIIRYGTHPTPFGNCLLAATSRGICALRFIPPGDVGEVLGTLQGEWENACFAEDFEATGGLAERIFSTTVGGSAEPGLALHVRGTNFQVRVWEALLRVPPGAALTYGELALRAGAPGAARAVGTAVGQNPVAYLIPCHRVIRNSGVLGEYRWGAARKKAMLGWEAAHQTG